MKTTLHQIRQHDPCIDGWEKLLRSLGKVKADDEPLHIRTILDSNGLDDALWCLRAVARDTRVMRLYAVWCARQVQPLMTDQRSIDALLVAERHANGDATDAELAAARDAAWGAAEDAAWAAAWGAAEDAAEDAAWAAVRAAVRAAAENAAEDAAWAAVRAAQEKELRRVLDCMDAGQDPYPGIKGRGQ
jgi:hypothetical protein